MNSAASQETITPMNSTSANSATSGIATSGPASMPANTIRVPKPASVATAAVNVAGPVRSIASSMAPARSVPPRRASS